MKTRHLLIAVSLSCAAVGPWAVSSALAQENIERSCKARYVLHLLGAGDQGYPRDPDLNDRPEGHTIYEFSVRRGCGAAVPNRCRQRASEAALRCMTEHFKAVEHALAGSRPPAACTSEGVQNYDLNLLRAIKDVACPFSLQLVERTMREARPGGIYAVTVTVDGVVEGDTGCGGGNRKSITRRVGAGSFACMIGHPTPTPTPFATPPPRPDGTWGLGPTPTPTPTPAAKPTPTPTPAVKGKFTRRVPAKRKP